MPIPYIIPFQLLYHSHDLFSFQEHVPKFNLGNLTICFNLSRPFKTSTWSIMVILRGKLFQETNIFQKYDYLAEWGQNHVQNKASSQTIPKHVTKKRHSSWFFEVEWSFRRVNDFEKAELADNLQQFFFAAYCLQFLTVRTLSPRPTTRGTSTASTRAVSTTPRPGTGLG